MYESSSQILGKQMINWLEYVLIWIEYILTSIYKEWSSLTGKAILCTKTGLDIKDFSYLSDKKSHLH